MPGKPNDSRSQTGDPMRAQLLGQSLAGLFWLIIVLLSCFTLSL